MPQKRNNPPPPVMTWKKAAVVLVVAVIFDLVRMFFELFWLMGPALAGFFCTIGVNNALGTTVATLGGKIVATGCAAAAGVLGTVGFGVTETFGTVMAIAIGLFGWLIVFFLLAIINARIFKTAATSWLWSLLGLGVSIMPLIGTIPAISLTVWRLYHAQIKKDRAGLKKWTEATRSIQNYIEQAQQDAELAHRYREQQVAAGEI